jgi:hypothetical protein
MRKISSYAMLLACVLLFKACSDNEKLANTKLIVEWAPFTLAEGVGEATLIEASNALQTDFLNKQRGFIRRDLLKGKNNQWVDIVYWSSQADADQASKNAANSPACHQYFSLMAEVNHDDPGEGVLHFEQVKIYQ